MRALLAVSLLILWLGGVALAEDPPVPVAPNKGLAEVLAKAQASKRLRALEGGAYYLRTPKTGEETLIWVRTFVRPTREGVVELQLLRDTLGAEGETLEEEVMVGLDGRFRFFSATGKNVKLEIRPNGEWLRVQVPGSRTQTRRWRPKGVHEGLVYFVLPRLRDALPKGGLTFLPCKGFTFKAETTLKPGKAGEVVMSGGEGAMTFTLSAEGELERVDAPGEFTIKRVATKAAQAWIKRAEAAKKAKHAKAENAGLSAADKARRARAKADLKRILTGSKLYRLNMGKWPEKIEDLFESSGPRWKGPYLDGAVPKDPWGNAYDYALGGGRPVVTSYGADGKLGGSGAAADIESK